MFIQNWTNSISNVIKADSIVISSRPSTTEVKEVKGVAKLCCLVEDSFSRLNGRDEGLNAHATTSNVERNTNHIEVQLLGTLQDWEGLVIWSSKLGAELADRVGIVSNDSQNESGIWEAFSNLFQVGGQAVLGRQL